MTEMIKVGQLVRVKPDGHARWIKGHVTDIISRGKNVKRSRNDLAHFWVQPRGLKEEVLAYGCELKTT